MSTSYSKGVLLERYFNRRAQSSISATPFFKLTSVQFGYGFLNTATNPATVKPVPLTASKRDITNVYIDHNPIYQYNAKTHQITVTAEIPPAAAGIPENGANINVACILDDQGEAVGMLVGQLSVINHSRGYTVNGIFETNLS